MNQELLDDVDIIAAEHGARLALAVMFNCLKVSTLAAVIEDLRRCESEQSHAAAMLARQVMRSRTH